MNELLAIAEEEMIELRHPYVGTEHFILAYLKNNMNEHVSYLDFKNKLIELIGSSYKESEYVLYTPLLRKYIASEFDIREVFQKILRDDNSIAYNILLNMNVDIEKMLNNL